MAYRIVDRLTGEKMGGKYKNRSRASNRRDKLDNNYGSYRYAVIKED